MIKPQSPKVETAMESTLIDLESSDDITEFFPPKNFFVRYFLKSQTVVLLKDTVANSRKN